MKILVIGGTRFFGIHMVNELLAKGHDVTIATYCSNDIKYVLDVVDCDKYIHMSSTSVYEPKHINTTECDFDGVSKELVWCDRKVFSV